MKDRKDGHVDATKVNTIEGELDSFVAKRDAQRRLTEGEREREALYMESVRRHHAQRQEAFAWQWLDYHRRRQAAHRQTFALLESMHEQEIQRYSEMLGLVGHERTERMQHD